MNSSYFKQKAREKLNGKWGKAICILLAYILVNLGLSFILTLLPLFGPILAFLFELPLAFGLVFAFFKLFYGEDISAFDFLKLGFSNFGRSWGIAFRTALKLIVPLILFIISYILFTFSITIIFLSGFTSSSSFGTLLLLISSILTIISGIWMFVKSYHYSLAQFVAFDEPHLTPKQCVEKSAYLMNGICGKLFVLQLSFIGWILLLYFASFILGLLLPISSISLIVGVLFLVPYLQLSIIAFYDTFANERKTDFSEPADLNVQNDLNENN